MAVALRVRWSPYVAVEVARVTTGSCVREALAESEPIGTALADHVEDAMESMAETDDAVVTHLEQLWEVPTRRCCGRCR